MRHRPLGLIRSQIFERAFGVDESARTVGAAKGVEIRAHTEEEAGSSSLGSVQVERVEAGTRIGAQLGHVNGGGEQLSLDLAGLLVIAAWPFGKRLLEGARRFCGSPPGLLVARKLELHPGPAVGIVEELERVGKPLNGGGVTQPELGESQLDQDVCALPVGEELSEATSEICGHALGRTLGGSPTGD